jgi:hypothetical protein
MEDGIHTMTIHLKSIRGVPWQYGLVLKDYLETPITEITMPQDDSRKYNLCL